MSCTSCSAKFSFFCKELQCPICLLSFCAKCLKSKIIVNKKKEATCVTCASKSSNKQLDEEMEPPALLLKRLENLENPAKPPVTVFRANPKFENLKRGLSKEDMEIVNRLEKLKEKSEHTAVPSEQEISKRLKMLKGQEDFEEGSSSKPMVNTVFKTNTEQVDDLLMKYMEEVNLGDSHALNVDDLQTRLSSLKGEKSTVVNEKMADSESEDENLAVMNIIKRATEEAALPDTGELSPVDISPPAELWEPELPWCEICNEDGTICCISCDNALYCNRCLKETHDREDLKEHRTRPFQKGKS